MWATKAVAVFRWVVHMPDRRKATIPVEENRRHVCWREANQLYAEAQARFNQTVRLTSERLDEILGRDK